MQADPDTVIEQIASELPEVDRADRLARASSAQIMSESFTEAVSQGVRGWADDDLAFAKPWGFELEDVTAEVRLWQGELDVLAPRATASTSRAGSRTHASSCSKAAATSSTRSGASCSTG